MQALPKTSPETLPKTVPCRKPVDSSESGTSPPRGNSEMGEVASKVKVPRSSDSSHGSCPQNKSERIDQRDVQSTSAIPLQTSSVDLAGRQEQQQFVWNMVVARKEFYGNFAKGEATEQDRRFLRGFKKIVALIEPPEAPMGCILSANQPLEGSLAYWHSQDRKLLNSCPAGQSECSEEYVDKVLKPLKRSYTYNEVNPVVIGTDVLFVPPYHIHNRLAQHFFLFHLVSSGDNKLAERILGIEIREYPEVLQEMAKRQSEVTHLYHDRIKHYLKDHPEAGLQWEMSHWVQYLRGTQGSPMSVEDREELLQSGRKIVAPRKAFYERFAANKETEQDKMFLQGFRAIVFCTEECSGFMYRSLLDSGQPLKGGLTHFFALEKKMLCNYEVDRFECSEEYNDKVLRPVTKSYIDTSASGTSPYSVQDRLAQHFFLFDLVSSNNNELAKKVLGIEIKEYPEVQKAMKRHKDEDKQCYMKRIKPYLKSRPKACLQWEMSFWVSYLQKQHGGSPRSKGQ